MELTIEVSKHLSSYTGQIYDGYTEIGHARVISEGSKWTITQWYINSDYMKKGYGRLLMRSVLRSMCNETDIRPTEVEYIWNGVNKYVHEWLERNFNATCKVNEWASKGSAEDDWSNHIYRLDANLFRNYFEL